MIINEMGEMGLMHGRFESACRLLRQPGRRNEAVTSRFLSDNRAVLKDVTFQEKDGEVSINIDTSRKGHLLPLPAAGPSPSHPGPAPDLHREPSLREHTRQQRHGQLHQARSHETAASSHLAFFLTAPSVFDVDGQGNRVKLKISRVEKEGRRRPRRCFRRPWSRRLRPSGTSP